MFHVQPIDAAGALDGGWQGSRRAAFASTERFVILLPLLGSNGDRVASSRAETRVIAVPCSLLAMHW